MEAPTNYPYFTKDGWASVDPSATERSYRLKCRYCFVHSFSVIYRPAFRKLAKGDEIFSIEKESSDEQESQFIPVSSSVSSSTRKRASSKQHSVVVERSVQFTKNQCPNIAPTSPQSLLIRCRVATRTLHSRKTAANETSFETDSIAEGRN